jgi:hypothetical protein
MSLVEHYSRRARLKGYYADTRFRVHQLDSDESGFFCGIRKAVADSLVDFEVPVDERGEWWLMKSEAERGIQIFMPIEPKPVLKRGRK